MPAPFPPLLTARFEAAVSRLIRQIKPWNEDLAEEAWAKRHELVEHFRSNLAVSSASLYAGMLSDWIDWLDQLPLSDAPTSPRVIEAYLQWKSNQGSAAASQGVRVSMIRLCLGKLGALSPEALECLQRARRSYQQPSPAKRPAGALPATFIRSLEETTDLNNPQQLGDTALVVLLSDTLIRPQSILGELVAGTWIRLPAQVADLTQRPDGSGVLAIRTSGGRAEPDAAALSHFAMKWLNLWLRTQNHAPGPLFRLADGQAASKSTLQAVLKRVATRTRMGKKLSLRSLRRLTASSMLAAGVHVQDVHLAFRANGMKERSWMPSRQSPAKNITDALLAFHRRRRSSRNAYGADLQPQLPLFH